MSSQSPQQRRVARIFWSSPFGGLEEERELLTKKYWPQLSQMCQKAGYEYVPVDMRWGITSDHSTQALTIEICLRELDRSDMIVGFFGQRYGWHGENDKMLQKTFDYACSSYPFIDGYRDRSVTELEFLHGHLNNPGSRAASFFFRDKAFDDRKLEEFEAAGDERNARKYRPTSDGPNAVQRLQDLKQSVLATRDKCLAVQPSYFTPSEGARLMFEAVKTFLEDFLKPQRALSVSEAERLEHHAFLLQKLGMGGMYIGGEGYLNEVDEHVLEDMANYKGKHLVIVGEPGSGKTCLLGNWLIKHQKQYPDDIVVYHLVGCSSSSTGVKNVLQKLCNDIEDALFDVENVPSGDRVYASKGKEEIRELQQALKVLVGKTTRKQRRVIIVIDALNMLEKAGKTVKTLYWLPVLLPDSAHFILSTVSEDSMNIKELTERREFDQLKMVPLSEDLQSQITKAMLILRGKELSSKQHNRVISCQQTENPLFLMILLQELCNFGSFFELDDYIDSLLAAQNVTELFIKFLKRLEKDYNPAEKKNLVQEVMCCLLVARHGLSEGEIKTTLGVSDQMWSTLYFAMNTFVVEKSGLYVFAYNELADAVRHHFGSNNNLENQFRKLVCDHFYEKFTMLSQRYDTEIPERVLSELPWLLCKLDAKEELRECLLHLAMFNALYRDQYKYDLVDYWNNTGVKGHDIQQFYMDAIDDQVALLYTESTEETGSPPIPSPGQQLVAVVASISDFLEEAGHRTVLKPLLQRAIRMLPLKDETAVLGAEQDAMLEYFARHNQLARFCADTDRLDDALAIHERLLALKEKLDHNIWMSEKAVTLNNMGYAELKRRKYEKVYLEYFQRALALHKEKLEGSEIHELIATSTNNVGFILCIMGRYEEAVKMLERALEIYEELYYDSLPPDVGGTLLNLAKCHVRNPDKTPGEVEAMYQRAIAIRENAYGRKHPEVAQVLRTYGAYMQRLQKYDRALELYLEALDINKVAYGPEGLETTMVLENVATIYDIKKQYEDAIPYFNKAGEALFRLGLMDHSMKSLNTNMLRYFVQQGRLEEAHHALERVITTQFATEDMFVTLDQLDERLLGDQRPNRPFEHTLDYALQKFPSSMCVLGRKLVLLARTGEADILLDIIQKNPGGKDPGLYMYAYKTFVDCDHRDEGKKILLAAAELFPKDLIVLENLAKCHGFYKQYPKALEVMQTIHSISPRDVDLLILGANLLAMNGQLQECREELMLASQVANESQEEENIQKVKSILKNIEEIIASQGTT